MPPNLTRLSIAASIFGIAYSIICVQYYLAISRHAPWDAAVVDLQLGFLAVGSLQAWENSGRRFVVLAAEVLGMAFGSFVAVKYL